MQVSTLNFVDLAGSERSTLAAKDDGDNKLRQTEGSAINKSLLTLGNVIRGLGDGRVSHTLLVEQCTIQALSCWVGIRACGYGLGCVQLNAVPPANR